MNKKARKPKINSSNKRQVTSRINNLISDRKVNIDPPKVEELQLRFRFELLDLDHKKYSLHKIKPDSHKKFLQRIQYLERMTLKQARANKTIGEYSLHDLKGKNAPDYARLVNIPPKGTESVLKVVIDKSGSARVFAHREGNEIYIIWYDANHEVWPENKIVRG